jgi:hypothetical protein
MVTCTNGVWLGHIPYGVAEVSGAEDTMADVNKD